MGKGSDYFLISQMFIEKFCVYEKINEFFCLFNFYSLTLHQGYALTAYFVAFFRNPNSWQRETSIISIKIATTASYVFFTTRAAVTSMDIGCQEPLGFIFVDTCPPFIDIPRQKKRKMNWIDHHLPNEPLWMIIIN